MSPDSGIKYLMSYPIRDSLLDKEMRDELVWEKIKQNWDRPLTFFQRIKESFDIIMGDHYDQNLNGHGSKGLLDFLILPLLSRKLLYLYLSTFKFRKDDDPYFPPSYAEYLRNLSNSFWFIFTSFIGAPILGIVSSIELARVVLSTAITVLSLPVITGIHFLKKQQGEQLKKDALALKVSYIYRGENNVFHLEEKPEDLGVLLQNYQISPNKLVKCKREIFESKNGTEYLEKKSYFHFENFFDSDSKKSRFLFFPNGIQTHTPALNAFGKFFKIVNDGNNGENINSEPLQFKL